MRNLIYLIIRYSAFILFVLLEVLAFTIIVKFNQSQKEIWMHSSNLLAGSLNKRVEKVEDYFDLQVQNDSLVAENARLRETIINYRVSSRNNAFQNFEQQDSLNFYELIPVLICNKTLMQRNNFLTIDKGSKHGIEVGMGVISDNGIVGIIKAVSTHFSTVLLITNSQSRISAKVNRNNLPGSLIWTNPNPRILNLADIPKHADIEIGDSISTSGYSISFPPDLYIGKISDFTVEGGGNNYNIKVRLGYEIAQLEHVYVIKYTKKEEKEEMLELENE